MAPYLRPASAALVVAAVAAAQDPGPAAHGHEHPGEHAPQHTILSAVDISFDLLAAAGTSTVRGRELRDLQGGHHDPRRRGFTFQQGELGLAGDVDRFFRAEAYLILGIDADEGETEVELEEAVLTTRRLPGGLELELGMMFTEFGRHNPRHPHDWEWLDQPIAHNRVFGPDGMRAVGARLGWRVADSPWRLHAGVQNAEGETMASFRAADELYDERAVGGRPFVAGETRSLADLVWSARAEGRWDAAGGALRLGASALFGPNATGPGGETRVYGADLSWAARERETGAGVSFEGEVLYRDFRADAFFDPGDPAVTGDEVLLPRDDLADWGLYGQLSWHAGAAWTLGVRYEYAEGTGSNYDAASGAALPNASDPFRADRHRVSPLLSWRATEHARLRLQYSYDDTSALAGGDAHSVWLGFEVAFHSAARDDHDH